MPLAVIAEIGPRGRVVRAVALCARGRVIAVATRDYRDGAVVIVAVIIVAVAVVVVGVVIGAGRECAADYRPGSDAGPESAAMAMTPSAVPVTAVPVTARKSAAARIGRTANAAADIGWAAAAKPVAGKSRSAAGCGSRSAEATTTSHGAAAHAGAATSESTAATADANRAATTGANTTAAPLELRKTFAGHCKRQHQRQCGCYTQNFQTAHFRLHFRDGSQPPRRGDVPEPAPLVRDCEPVSARLYGR